MTRRDRADDAEHTDTAPPRGPDHEWPLGGAESDADAPPSSADPRRIESLAVTENDVVAALEATARGRREIVLRITPPFSGRMRARLHDAGAVDADGDREAASPTAAEHESSDSNAAPVSIPPERFVADCPPYPTVDDTEDELRASETPYTRDRHRKRHQAAVEAWREAVHERLIEESTLHTDAGPTTVSIAYLG